MGGRWILGRCFFRKEGGNVGRTVGDGDLGKVTGLVLESDILKKTRDGGGSGGKAWCCYIPFVLGIGGIIALGILIFLYCVLLSFSLFRYRLRLFQHFYIWGWKNGGSQLEFVLFFYKIRYFYFLTASILYSGWDWMEVGSSEGERFRWTANSMETSKPGNVISSGPSQVYLLSLPPLRGPYNLQPPSSAHSPDISFVHPQTPKTT